MPAPCNIVRVEDIAPVPWKNGGGVTRELLAWPDPRHWILRISVAQIRESGPFSLFPGVDRWIAVLSGGSVRLETEGLATVELNPSRTQLQPFSGDLLTHCEAGTTESCDFNVMLQRAQGRLTPHAVQELPAMESTANLLALFVVASAVVTTEQDEACHLPSMALASWPNPQRERCSLRVAGSHSGLRGWWLQLEV